MNTLVVTVLLLLADGPPEAKDVKAGWIAFGVFLALIAATVVLCISFVQPAPQGPGSQGRRRLRRQKVR